MHPSVSSAHHSAWHTAGAHKMKVQFEFNKVSILGTHYIPNAGYAKMGGS